RLRALLPNAPNAAGRLVAFVVACWHVQAPERWPAYHPSAREALAAEEGLFVPTGDAPADYLAFRHAFLALAAAVGLTGAQAERAPAYEVAAAPTVRRAAPSHTHVQWQLARLGRAVGCKVWIAANDHARAWNGEPLGTLSVPRLPRLGLDEESERLVRLIDVV